MGAAAQPVLNDRPSAVQRLPLTLIMAGSDLKGEDSVMAAMSIAFKEEVEAQFRTLARNCFPAGIRQEVRAWRATRDLALALDKVGGFSMIRRHGLVTLGKVVRQVLDEGIPGAFVECGVWRGGASFLMADLLKRAGAKDRKVWLFDSFEGHLPPEEIDGPAALEYAANTDSPEYHDNCRVSVEEVRANARTLGLESYTEIVKGWFQDSVPPNRERIGPIGMLRVDCDFYASVRFCLDTLYDQVVPGGFVILDDYYTYDGCALAVHEFLGGRQLAHRLLSPGDDEGVFFRKS